MYVAVTERQATPTQVFSYGIVYLHFYEIKMSLYSQKGIVDPVETWVNARLKMYGGKGGERKMQT